MLIACKLHGFSKFFSVVRGSFCLLETMRWEADASSRRAAPQRRLVGRVLFPAARAAQPVEHEELLSNRRRCTSWSLA